MRDQKRVQRDDKLQDGNEMGEIIDAASTKIASETVNKENPKEDAQNGHMTEEMRNKHRGTYP